MVGHTWVTDQSNSFCVKAWLRKRWDRQTDRQTDKQTNKQTNKQTDKRNKKTIDPEWVGAYNKKTIAPDWVGDYKKKTIDPDWVGACNKKTIDPDWVGAYNKVVYANSSHEFDIELDFEIFLRITTIQTVKSYISALALDRQLWLSVFADLIFIYNIYDYRRASIILWTVRDISMLILWNCISQLWVMLGI